MTAKGFVGGTIKQKRSGTFDRQHWWLKDGEAQLQFNVVWESGMCNLADYFAKHHTGKHHLMVRPICSHCSSSPTSLQGCAETFENKEGGQGFNGVTNQPRLSHEQDPISQRHLDDSVREKRTSQTNIHFTKHSIRNIS